MTIREVARTGLISEHYLRLREKQHRLPCVYSGKTCLVNYPLLVEQLDAESAAQTQKEAPCAYPAKSTAQRTETPQTTRIGLRLS